MILQVLGCSSSYTSKKRATSGYLLRGNFGGVLIDCGYSVAERVAAHYDSDRLTAVVLSHMHRDHCDSLCALGMLLHNRNFDRVRVFVPPGEAETATELWDIRRVGGFEVTEYDGSETLCIGSLQIVLRITRHPIKTYAMRFRESGSSKELIYTADTGWYDGLVEFSYGAHLMLVEAGDYPSADTLVDNERWHLTPDEAGRLIREAGVEKAIITHYEPRYSEKILAIAARASGSRDVVLAVEGAEYTI